MIIIIGCWLWTWLINSLHTTAQSFGVDKRGCQFFSIHCLDILQVNVYVLYKETSYQHPDADKSTIQNHKHLYWMNMSIALSVVVILKPDALILPYDLLLQSLYLTHQLYTKQQWVEVLWTGRIRHYQSLMSNNTVQVHINYSSSQETKQM